MKPNSKSKEYGIWSGMKDRCRNPNSRSYHRYGGRGIKVCERWLVFANFIADMGPRPAGTSLNRIDNDKGYSPENCEWADEITQQNNRSNNIIITHDGRSLTITQWSKITGLSFRAIESRYRAKWPTEKILDPAPISRERRREIGRMGGLTSQRNQAEVIRQLTAEVELLRRSLRHLVEAIDCEENNNIQIPAMRKSWQYRLAKEDIDAATKATP